MTRRRAAVPAFAYVRVSSTGQLDGHGIDRQRETIAAFAKRRGLDVVETFEDAHTGTEADRPGFSALLAALQSNGTRTVCVESLDRLARSLSVQMALLATLERVGATLLSASTGQDVTADMRDDPMREAMVLMQGVFAQAEKKLLVRKLRRARDAKRAAEGRCEGQRPYGQDPERPEEVEVVHQIKVLGRRKDPLTGRKWSSARVAAELDRLGLSPRSGRTWNRSTVRDVMLRG